MRTCGEGGYGILVREGGGTLKGIGWVRGDSRGRSLQASKEMRARCMEGLQAGHSELEGLFHASAIHMLY